jgi:hypothetical protein
MGEFHRYMKATVPRDSWPLVKSLQARTPVALASQENNSFDELESKYSDVGCSSLLGPNVESHVATHVMPTQEVYLRPRASCQRSMPRECLTVGIGWGICASLGKRYNIPMSNHM